ncbi:hypothetical protein BHE74_00036312 [Ensete ventricosum]|nr:hypothetical protein BHE74_00036312 [Ensete ventricosum]
MRLGTRLECVGSSPRVSGACQDGAREFVGRRSRLVRRLSGTMQWDLVGSSLGDSLKGLGSLMGTRQEIAERRSEDSSQECQRLADWWEPGTTQTGWWYRPNIVSQIVSCCGTTQAGGTTTSAQSPRLSCDDDTAH